ncbi:MAG: NUDIX domain-containing protein [Patescibacteria group bacterium]
MRRVTVRGIIIKDGKLFAQRLNKRDGGVKDYWCTPGGGLDDGESLHDGLAREMIEETGVKPVIGRLLFVQQYADEKREYLEFFFEITNANDYEQIDLQATTHGAAEVAEFGFIDVTKERILPKSLQVINLSLPLEEKVQIANYLA